MASRLLTFAVWALVAASGLFWSLRLFARAPGLPEAAQVPVARVAMGGDLGRVLGTVDDPATDDEPVDDGGGRFQLLGVVSPPGTSPSPQGVALIAVSGQPAKAFRTGMVVEGNTVLMAVSKRSAELGPKGGAVAYTLTLPEPARPATVAPGTLPVRPAAPLPGSAGLPGHPAFRPAGNVPGAVPLPVPQNASGDDDED